MVLITSGFVLYVDANFSDKDEQQKKFNNDNVAWKHDRARLSSSDTGLAHNIPVDDKKVTSSNVQAYQISKRSVSFSVDGQYSPQGANQSRTGDSNRCIVDGIRKNAPDRATMRYRLYVPPNGSAAPHVGVDAVALAEHLVAQDNGWRILYDVGIVDHTVIVKALLECERLVREGRVTDINECFYGSLVSMIQKERAPTFRGADRIEGVYANVLTRLLILSDRATSVEPCIRDVLSWAIFSMCEKDSRIPRLDYRHWPIPTVHIYRVLDLAKKYSSGISIDPVLGMLATELDNAACVVLDTRSYTKLAASGTTKTTTTYSMHRGSRGVLVAGVDGILYAGLSFQTNTSVLIQDEAVLLFETPVASQSSHGRHKHVTFRSKYYSKTSQSSDISHYLNTGNGYGQSLFNSVVLSAPAKAWYLGIPTIAMQGTTAVGGHDTLVDIAGFTGWSSITKHVQHFRMDPTVYPTPNQDWIEALFNNKTTITREDVKAAYNAVLEATGVNRFVTINIPQNAPITTGGYQKRGSELAVSQPSFPAEPVKLDGPMDDFFDMSIGQCRRVIQF